MGWRGTLYRTLKVNSKQKGEARLTVFSLRNHVKLGISMAGIHVFHRSLVKQLPIAVVQYCMVTCTLSSYPGSIYPRLKAPGGGGPLPSKGAPNAMPSGPVNIPCDMNPGGGGG